MNCAHCHADDATGDEGPDLHGLRKTDERLRLLIVSPCYLAIVSIGLGDKEQALGALEAAATRRDLEIGGLKMNPIFD